MTVPTHRLPRVLTWKSGAFLGLTTILGVFTTVGYMIGLVGAWSVIAVWAVSMAVATAQAFLYAEMATMFPNMAGGVAAYANEGLRRYTVFVGPIVSWGYWLGYSLVQAAVALIFGQVVQAQWFPTQTWGADVLGVHIGLPHLLGAAALVSVFLLNIFGIRPAARVTSWGVIVFTVFVAIMVVLPFIEGKWSGAGLTWRLDDPKLALVLLYLAGWTTYAVEGPSLFAPEYRSPGSDTPKAIRVCAMLMIGVFTIVPFVVSGTLGEKVIGDNPNGYAVDVMNVLWPGSSSLVVAVVAIGLWVTLVGTSAQAGRALLGISRSDLTVKQLSTLNSYGMPGRALGVDLVVNLLILFLVGNTVAIVAASNLGYFICCGLACWAYVLLRRDRPEWPRPYRLSRKWGVVAIALGIFDFVVAAVGITNPDLAGRGGLKETLIALVLLFVCVPLFLLRRLWQDRDQTFAWREETPVLPSGDEHVVTEDDLPPAGPVDSPARPKATAGEPDQ
jgi:amino acid transporter